MKEFLVDRRDDLDAIRLECEMTDAEAALWLIARETMKAVENLQERVATLEGANAEG